LGDFYILNIDNCHNGVLCLEHKAAEKKAVAAQAFAFACACLHKLDHPFDDHAHCSER
jgi:hypothetical protein